MKPFEFSPAHKYHGFAELVCSNSLKSMLPSTAQGMLKTEMELLGSLILDCAKVAAVPAGSALAVEREQFSDLVTSKIKAHPLITIVSGKVSVIPKDGITVIATGPLTDSVLADEIGKITGGMLSFFDAAAPIVTAESIDNNKSFLASRYGKGSDDYINCPFTKDEYEVFHKALINAESVELHSFEKESFRVYEGCMPVEVLAKRGEDSIRFGPLKPVGLTVPWTGKRPYANVQLRAENKECTLYNLVGFQTNLKFGEQKRVFSLIPSLENAEFVRYGVMHRNSFINSPKILLPSLNMRCNENIYFAGQITGVEGYMESAMCGIVAGLNIVRRLKGFQSLALPLETMSGALMHFMTNGTSADFQPIGASMGILPELEKTQPKKLAKKDKYQLYAERGLEKMQVAISVLQGGK
jgi:methylenetetrahydrofolate--tRNA-(uracil-5-)-methyltransferase